MKQNIESDSSQKNLKGNFVNESVSVESLSDENTLDVCNGNENKEGKCQGDVKKHYSNNKGKRYKKSSRKNSNKKSSRESSIKLTSRKKNIANIFEEKKYDDIKQYRKNYYENNKERWIDYKKKYRKYLKDCDQKGSHHKLQIKKH